MYDHSEYRIGHGLNETGMYANAEISSEYNSSAIAPIIQLQFGDAGFTGCSPVVPALQIHSPVGNSVGKIM